MFKSVFRKYLVAFILIISISFLLLSGIISLMIRGYSMQEKEKQLSLVSLAVAADFEKRETDEPGAIGALDIASDIITPLITLVPNIDIILVSAEGEVLLSTIGAQIDEDYSTKSPILDSKEHDLGVISVDSIVAVMNSDKIYRGNLDEYLKSKSMVVAEDIVVDGTVRGYILSSCSISKDDGLVVRTRRAVINSSIWILLAAIIAAYFISQKIINPLRNMTDAAKKFGKGDFSERVAVTGKDEVAELATAFNNMAESLDKLEKMRSSFLASISHDLRTPMTTISGFIDGIMSGAIPPEKQADYLQIISAEVHRMSRLVTQLLDVSRLESGDRKMVFTTFDIAELSRIALLSFEQKIEDKHLEVEFESDRDEMNVYADKDAIHQVIYNLFHNAIKFSREGGKLAIKISDYDNKKIRISVFDEGESISEEDSKMIFERFYKTDASRGLDKNGVGLGLYICKTIMDAHEEQIRVNSTENIGTEFWFTVKKEK